MSRVIDCVLFNDEWDVLALRFATLVDVVDTFIIVEGDRTFSGKPRQSMAGRIADMAPPHKQCLVITVPMPAPLPDTWVPERAQRNAMQMGLFATRAEASDHILMGDLDEIPNPQYIRHVGTHWQRKFMYYLNAAFDDGLWPGTIGLPYTALQYYTPAGIRTQTGGLPRIASGWHFSYMANAGSLAPLHHKIRSYAETEFDTDAVHDGLAANMAALTDPLGRKELQQDGHIVPVDASFPLPLQRQPSRWAHMIAAVPP